LRLCRRWAWAELKWSCNVAPKGSLLEAKAKSKGLVVVGIVVEGKVGVGGLVGSSPRSWESVGGGLEPGGS
jgi:hypothetical protein